MGLVVSGERTVVDKLYDDFNELVSFLKKGDEVSFCNLAGENFTKVLLLAAASYFEDRLVKELLEFVSEVSKENKLLVELVKKKALDRQYHTFFDWKGKNANQFFGLFGDSFKDFMKNEVENDAELAEALRAFLEIGRERNRLVHQNFATFSLEKTVEEVYQSYQVALYFVESIPDKLRQFSS